MRFGLALVGAALLATGAQAVTVVNGSFESGVAIPGTGVLPLATGDTTSVTGWTVLSSGVDYVSSDKWNAAAGRRSIELSGGNLGGVSQRIGGFTVGEQYRVRFSLSANPFGPDRNYRTTVSATGGTAQTFNYGATALNTPTNMLYRTYEYLFTASNAFQNIQFRSLDIRNTEFGPVLDKVSVSLVPEPASWLMLIAGFGMTGFAMRRRKMSSVSA